MKPRLRHLLSSLSLTVTVAMAAALSSSAAAMAPAPGPKPPPNVLMIIVDDLNDWVGAYGGHPQTITPNLDRLARLGTRFEHVDCAAPICNPSRVAVLSGLSPQTSGVYDNYAQWTDSPAIQTVPSLPAYLKSQGYATFTGGKVFHHDAGPDSDPGAWTENYTPPGPYPVATHPYAHGLQDKLSTPRWKRALAWGPYDDALDAAGGDSAIATKAIEVLNRPHAEPFFLAVGLRKPHLPWFAPAHNFAKFPPEDMKLPAILADDLDDLPATGREWGPNDDVFRTIKENGKWQEAVAAYLACINYADENVGRILDAYLASPDRDNTILLLWSDHGFHLGEKEHWEKYTLWERATSAVMYAIVPGVTTPGSAIAAPVSLQSLYPTICSLLDLPKPPHVEGADITPLLANPDAPEEQPVVISHGPGNFAVRDLQYRYIRYADGGEELYDHLADPHEWHNRAADPALAEVKARLRAAVPEHWVDAVKASNP